MTTPTARPLRTSTRATSASVRISAPADCAERFRASLSAPIPPRTKPHRPRTPPTPPITWCSSTYAVPGDDGPPLVPMTPSVARASLSSSDSNQSSSTSRALAVNMRASSPSSAGRMRITRQPRPPSAVQSARRRGGRLGGACSSIGSMKLRDAFDEALVGRVALGVAARKPGDLRAGAALVGVHRQRPPIEVRGEIGRVLGQDLVAEAAQLEVTHDALLQQADQIRRRRDAIARKHLLGHARPADQVPALQNEHLPARPRQIPSRHEPVMPAPDDDRVVHTHRLPRPVYPVLHVCSRSFSAGEARYA